MTFCTPPTPEVERFVKDAHEQAVYLGELNLIQYLAYDPPHPVYCEIGETKTCTCHKEEVIAWAKEESVARWLGGDP